MVLKSDVQRVLYYSENDQKRPFWDIWQVVVSPLCQNYKSFLASFLYFFNHANLSRLIFRILDAYVFVQMMMNAQNQKMRVEPLYVVIDTNAFIDHLSLVDRIARAKKYQVVVPLTG